MRLGAKIGIGIAILLVCVLALASTLSTTTPPAKNIDNNESNNLPYNPNLLKGTTNEELTVGNIGIVVSPPIYTETVYQEIHSTLSKNDYWLYRSREDYHFVVMKAKVINNHKKEITPYFDDITLETKKELIYENGVGYNHTLEFCKDTPSLLFESVKPFPDVLPKDSEERYFRFEIPEKARVKELHFNYTTFFVSNEEKEIIIELPSNQTLNNN